MCPPKKGNEEVELKVRVPKELSEKVNDFRHKQKMESKKQAVVFILEAFFSNDPETDLQKGDEQ